jgi:hypothetical protein
MEPPKKATAAAMLSRNRVSLVIEASEGIERRMIRQCIGLGGAVFECPVLMPTHTAQPMIDFNKIWSQDQGRFR